jgi:hypothetical protein
VVATSCARVTSASNTGTSVLAQDNSHRDKTQEEME